MWPFVGELPSPFRRDASSLCLRYESLFVRAFRSLPPFAQFDLCAPDRPYGADEGELYTAFVRLTMVRLSFQICLPKVDLS